MPASTGRSGRSRRSALVVAIVLACVAGIATALVLTMPRVTPIGPLELTNDATPVVKLKVAHPAGLGAGDVTVQVDGHAIEGDRIEVSDAGQLISAELPRQDDGTHEVTVTSKGVGILQRTISTHWTLRVDTKPPSERILSPVPNEAGDSAYVAEGVAPVTKAPLQLKVDAEEGTTIDVTSTAEGAKATHDDASKVASRTIAVPLPQGAQLLTVVATDKAGNETTRRMRVLVDTIGPRITATVPRVVRDNTLALPIAAHDPHGVELRVLIDGNELEDAIQTISSTPPPNADGGDNATDDDTDETGGSQPAVGGCSDDDSDNETNCPDTSAVTTDTTESDDEATEEPAPIAGTYKVVIEDGVLEGRHTLEVIATDSLGTRTKLTRRLLVDSGEDLGDVAGMRAGARGRDVSQLHQALIDNKIVGRAALANDLRTRTYGAQTAAAVKRFQAQRGMSEDGIAGGDTIAALTLKIVVDRSANTLTLYRMGDVVKTWGVATGSSEYPTPSGEFEIQTMQKDPTWTPPDSAWAKDAKPIGPGADNPLGTRWMAINGTVGIHGTNNPASIGYSVSHGCIRMRIPDVEELYSMVEIGTPVTVL